MTSKPFARSTALWSTEWRDETRPIDDPPQPERRYVVRYRRKPGAKAAKRPVFELLLDDGSIVERRAYGDISGPPRWVKR